MKNKTLGILVALFILGLLTRIFLLNDGLYHQDTVRLARAVESVYLNGNISSLFGDYFINLRLGYLIINFIVFSIFRLFGSSSAEYSVLFTGALFGSLCVPMAYAFLKELTKSRFAALASAVLINFFPLLLLSNAIGKEEGAELFFFLLAMYFILRKKFLVSGFLIGIYSTIKWSSLIYLPLLGLLVLLIMKKNRVKNIAKVLVPALLIFTIMLNVSLMDRLIKTVDAPDGTNSYLKFTGYSKPKVVRIINETMFSFPLLLLPFVFYGLFKTNKKAKILLGIWLLYFLFYSGLNIFSSRYLVFPITCLFFLAGIGIYHASKLHRNAKYGLLILMIYALATMTTHTYPVLASRHELNTYKDLAMAFNEISDEGDMLMHFECTTVSYYIKDRRCIGSFTKENIEAQFSMNRSVYTTSNSMKALKPDIEEKDYFLNNKWNYVPVLEFYFEDWHSPLISRDLYPDMMAKVEKE